MKNSKEAKGCIVWVVVNRNEAVAVFTSYTKADKYIHTNLNISDPTKYFIYPCFVKQIQAG